MPISIKDINYRAAGSVGAAIRDLSELNEGKNWGLRFGPDDTWAHVLGQLSLISSISLAVDVDEGDVVAKRNFPVATLGDVVMVGDLRELPAINLVASDSTSTSITTPVKENKFTDTHTLNLE